MQTTFKTAKAMPSKRLMHKMPNALLFSLSLALVSVWNKEHATYPCLPGHSEKCSFGSCSASFILLPAPACPYSGHKGQHHLSPHIALVMGFVRPQRGDLLILLVIDWMLVLCNTWNSITDDCRNCRDCVLAYDIKINSVTAVIYLKFISWVSDEAQLKIYLKVGLKEIGDELDSKGTDEILQPVVCRKATNHNLTLKYVVFWDGDTISSCCFNFFCLLKTEIMVNTLSYGKYSCQWELSKPSKMARD